MSQSYGGQWRKGQNTAAFLMLNNGTIQEKQTKQWSQFKPGLMGEKDDEYRHKEEGKF